MDRMISVSITATRVRITKSDLWISGSCFRSDMERSNRYACLRRSDLGWSPSGEMHLVDSEISTSSILVLFPRSFTTLSMTITRIGCVRFVVVD